MLVDPDPEVRHRLTRLGGDGAEWLDAMWLVCQYPRSRTFDGRWFDWLGEAWASPAVYRKALTLGWLAGVDLSVRRHLAPIWLANDLVDDVRRLLWPY